MFARVLGAEFNAVSPRVRALHAARGTREYAGEVEVHRGEHWLSRLAGWATRLPPAGCSKVRVRIDATAVEEHWTRHMGLHAMPSRLWARDGVLCEQLSAVRFFFRLSVHDGALHWRVAGASLIGVPLPRSWFTDVRAMESEHEGRYRFDVHATLPGVGLLVHYHGWLRVE